MTATLPTEAAAPARRPHEQFGSREWAINHGSGLPTEAAARKNVPIYSGVMKYFPDAIAAIAACSQKGNDQHNPGQPLHWDRSKSGDELDALTRHLIDAGTVDSDGVRHSTKVAWRALANLQKEIEREALPAEQSDCAHHWIELTSAAGGGWLCLKCGGRS